jgi:hypothetical protein
MNNFRTTRRRYLAALLLTVIYLAITVSPLAPLALNSPRLAHAITGECSGDCDICGCSAERRANHTCCCQLKKKLEARHKSALPDCCQKKERSKETVLTCNCPCGSGKQLALIIPIDDQQIPFAFEPALSVPVAASEHLELPHLFTSRGDEPPEPPPRLVLIG